MNKLPAYIFIVLLLVSACALSPQVIDISPTLRHETSSNLDSKNTITIHVNDSRPSSLLGSRGGVYNETALLTTNPDMTNNIRATLIDAFKTIGYSVSDNTTATGLNVSISEFTYNNQKKTAVNSISVRAVIKVECRNSRYTMNNEYTITDGKDFIKPPSKRENATIVNATMNTALNKIFEDEKLFSCLNNQ